MRIVEPTNWHVRAGLSFADVIKVIGQMIKPGNLVYLIGAMFTNHNPKTPLEF